MTSPPPGSQRRAWWAPSAGGEGSRHPPDKLDVTHHPSHALTTPVSANTPSTSTSAAWASAVQHSQQHLHPEHTPHGHRPPHTPVTPPGFVQDPRRAPTREYELAPPREYGSGRSPRQLEAGRSPVPFESGRSPRQFEAGRSPREYERARPPSREYEGERLPGVREVGRLSQLPHEYEGARPKRDFEVPRPPRDYDGREIRLPPLEYGLARSGTPRAKERGEIERKHERRERDDNDDDDGRSSSQRSQRATATSASPAPGAFNGWDTSSLYYHAIHRLPPLSSWCSTVLEMSLKSAETWVVSRHADDLPPYARIMTFYGAERVEVPHPLSRTASERGSTRDGVEMRVGSPSMSSEISKPDPEAVLAAEIATVGSFVRRLETVVEALQKQMAPYDPTMPRTHLVGTWREIGDRIASRGNAEQRRDGAARHVATDEYGSMHRGRSPRPPKRRREREDGPVTAVLPLPMGRDWVTVAADSATGTVLIYDPGHALDNAGAELVADEVMRTVGEVVSLDHHRPTVRHIRPPDRVPSRLTVLVACAALEMFGSSPSPTADPSLPTYLGLWCKLLAQRISLALPPSFDRPAAAQSALYTKNVSASRILRDRIVWTVHTGTLACPFRGYW